MPTTPYSSYGVPIPASYVPPLHIYPRYSRSALIAVTSIHTQTSRAPPCLVVANFLYLAAYRFTRHSQSSRYTTPAKIGPKASFPDALVNGPPGGAAAHDPHAGVDYWNLPVTYFHLATVGSYLILQCSSALLLQIFPHTQLHLGYHVTLILNYHADQAEVGRGWQSPNRGPMKPTHLAQSWHVM